MSIKSSLSLADERELLPHLRGLPLVRIHFIIVMIRWTGLAPCEYESPFPGSLTSTFLTDEGELLPHMRGLPLRTQSQVVAQLTLLVAITVLHRSCSVAASLKTASPSPRRLQALRGPIFFTPRKRDGTGFRGSGFRFWVPGFRFRVPGFGFRVCAGLSFSNPGGTGGWQMKGSFYPICAAFLFLSAPLWSPDNAQTGS